MAYKYQPIKDEIFASDDEGEVEELEEGEEQELHNIRQDFAAHPIII